MAANPHGSADGARFSYTVPPSETGSSEPRSSSATAAKPRHVGATRPASERPRSGLCSDVTKAGKPCQAWAGPDGKCSLHSGRVDPRELGRRGGSRSPFTKLREVADDDLREEARAVMQRAMRGEDVPKAALDAARSLFSYGSTKPPEAEQPAQVQVASEEAVIARLAAPETWTPRLRDAINHASATDPEIKRKVAAFTREVRLSYGRTVAGLEEAGLVRVIPGSQAEQLRDDALEAQEEARSDLA